MASASTDPHPHVLMQSFHDQGPSINDLCTGFDTELGKVKQHISHARKETKKLYSEIKSLQNNKNANASAVLMQTVAESNKLDDGFHNGGESDEVKQHAEDATVDTSVQIDHRMRKIDWLNLLARTGIAVCRVLAGQRAKYLVDTSESSTETEFKQMEFYVEATSTLRCLTNSFELSQQVPLGSFARLVNRAREAYHLLVRRCPKLTRAAVAGATIGGAVLGVLTLSSVSALGASLIGAACGLGILVVVVGIVEIARWNSTRASESPEDREATIQQNRASQEKHLRQFIEQIEQQPEIMATDVVELHKQLQDLVMKPLRDAPQDDDECAICKIPGFTSDDVDLEGVRAPRCEGFHWIHRRCHRRWVGSSGDYRCIICRR
eukprot:TRINITY_DN21805_c0_g1_i1.p1 TRINITY_DN21805_c0_g1~~TRINITY_DN21805_c0_g1_i1.p1  ORF type:complete len:379 (-),score=62.76 TRINITY_DN21805_c0_g1_i1:51-1187(-)